MESSPEVFLFFEKKKCRQIFRDFLQRKEEGKSVKPNLSREKERRTKQSSNGSCLFGE